MTRLKFSTVRDSYETQSRLTSRRGQCSEYQELSSSVNDRRSRAEIPEVSEEVLAEVPEEARARYNNLREQLEAVFSTWSSKIGEVRGPQSVTCPYCGEEPGDRCVTSSGNTRTYVHKDRERAFEDRQQAIEDEYHSRFEEGVQTLRQHCKTLTDRFHANLKERIARQTDRIACLRRDEEDSEFQIVRVQDGPADLLNRIIESDLVSALQEGDDVDIRIISSKTNSGGSRSCDREEPLFPDHVDVDERGVWDRQRQKLRELVEMEGGFPHARYIIELDSGEFDDHPFPSI